MSDVCVICGEHIDTEATTVKRIKLITGKRILLCGQRCFGTFNSIRYESKKNETNNETQELYG